MSPRVFEVPKDLPDCPQCGRTIRLASRVGESAHVRPCGHYIPASALRPAHVDESDIETRAVATDGGRDFPEDETVVINPGDAAEVADHFGHDGFSVFRFGTGEFVDIHISCDECRVRYIIAVYQALAYYHTHKEVLEAVRERHKRETAALRRELVAARPTASPRSK